MLGNLWTVNSTDTSDTFVDNPTLARQVEKRWNDTHTGPLAVSVGRWLGWFRHNLSAPIWDDIEDPSRWTLSDLYCGSGFSHLRYASIVILFTSTHD
jgi:hypothetical protein